MTERLTDGGPNRPPWIPPLWIPFAALTVTLTALAVLHVSARVNETPTPPPTVIHTTPAGTTPEPPTTAPVPSSTTSTVGTSTTSVLPDPAATVISFLQAWLTPGDAAARAKALGPFTTGEFLPALVDVSVLPAGSPVGMTVESNDGLTARVRFELDDGTAGRVVCVWTADGWRVNELEQA